MGIFDVIFKFDFGHFFNSKCGVSFSGFECTKKTKTRTRGVELPKKRVLKRNFKNIKILIRLFYDHKNLGCFFDF